MADNDQNSSQSRTRSRKVTRQAGPPSDQPAEKSTAQTQQKNSDKPAAEQNTGGKANQQSGGRAESKGSKNTDNAKSGEKNSGQGGNSNNRRRGSRGGRGRQASNGPRNVIKTMQGADLTKRLPDPPKAPHDGLRIVALGGISEIGRNMTVFEHKGRRLIVDCGVLFPSSDEPGVDLILPDFSYIEEDLGKVDALVVTHGHEDHIGAIPFLLKLRPDLPVVGSKFTLALIAAKCREHRQRPKLIEVREGQKTNHGPFEVEYIAVNHSIPDCLGLAIRTSAGTVVHTGDIKLDQTPTDGRPTDLPHFSRIGDEGVDLFMCDSTNASTPGFSGSEAEIKPTMKRLIGDAKQRVIVACFASNVYRVQSAIDAAVAAGRKVTFTGRSMIRNMGIAEEMGLLNAPRGTIIELDEASKLAPHKVVIITTGTQGEPMAALSRMARREHRQITVRDGDVIILSSSLVPGNEEAVFGVINMLAQIGATVITGRDAKVHTSGHGFAGELLFLYNAIRPSNVMPVHGEWRHLRDNKELAISTGVDRDRVVLAQNGVVVDLVDGRAQVVGQIDVGHLYVDGLHQGDIGGQILDERTMLSEGGMIAATVVIDARTSRPLGRPRVTARGFSSSPAAMAPIIEIVEDTMLDLAGQGENDPFRMAQQIRRRVGSYVSEKWRRKPMIVPTVIPTTVESHEDEDHEEDYLRSRPAQ